MENRKNLCAMIPEALYEKVGEEKGRLEMTLNQYVEMVMKEHFEGGKIMANGDKDTGVSGIRGIIYADQGSLKKDRAEPERLRDRAD